MNVRAATIEDVGRIAEIHVRSWRTAYKDALPAAFLAGLNVGRREAMWRSCVMSEGRLFVVEDEGAEIAGFISLASGRDADLAEATELTAIYLDPKYYGSGIGTRFWKEIEKDISTEIVYLWVLSRNPIGIAFYEKNGFRPDGKTKTFDIEGQTFLELRYRKELGG